MPQFVLRTQRRTTAQCDTVGRPIGINQPISPVRIRKVVRPNNIVPRLLCLAGYKYHYTLDQALEDLAAR